LRGAADGARRQDSGPPQAGLHGPAEGVLLQTVPGDGFVDLSQLADGEPRPEEAFRVGVFGIPSSELVFDFAHDLRVVVGATGPAVRRGPAGLGPRQRARRPRVRRTG
jgi:hypothetical protein